DVPKEIGPRRICLLADSLSPGKRRELVGGRQRVFDISRCVLPEEFRLMAGQPLRLPDLLHHRPGQRACGCARAFTLALPRACDFALAVEPFDGIVEVAHEPVAAEFAVGENPEAAFLL